MKKKQAYIKLLTSVVLLVVFSIALTPFSIFHHHDEVPPCAEAKKCAHNFHIHNHVDKCLICTAHFEKNYTSNQPYSETYLLNQPVSVLFTAISGTYAELISLALRGPPLA